MTREEAIARAKELFTMGYNCAQAVYGTFAPMLGMDLDTAMRISAPFGGGLGRMREVCGAVSGMCMALGMLGEAFDPADPDAKSGVYRETQKLVAPFKEANGTIICRELLAGVPVTPGPDAQKRDGEYYKKRPCLELVGDCAGYFWDYLQETGRG